MKLYKDDLPALVSEFKKTAGFALRLSETPENWPQELTSDLYKQLPFLSDYDMNVNLDRVDPQRGYAMGWADVTNKTERPEQEHDDAGIPHIRIPLVIQERQVRPYSVFLDEERSMPMSEERVREILFNPTTFDLSTQQPQDPSLVEQLMPPSRSGMGLGGEKFASADAAFFAGLSGKEKKALAISPEGHKADAERFRLYERHGAEAIRHNQKQGISGYRDDDGKDRKSSFKAALKGHGMMPMVDMRHAAYAAKKHEEGKNAWNPFGGMKTPSKYEGKGATKMYHGQIKEKFSEIDKTAFKHISKEQWEAIYNSFEVQKMMEDYGGDKKHPAIQNRVMELALKHYGFHPKPEPAPPQKMMEYRNKKFEKQQKQTQKQMEKGTKMMSEGQKLMGSGGGQKPKTASASSDVGDFLYGAPSRAEWGILGGSVLAGRALRHRAEQKREKKASALVGDRDTSMMDRFGIAGRSGKPSAMMRDRGIAGPRPKTPSGAMKLASSESLLLTIAPTINKADWDRFVEKIASSPTLVAGMNRSGARDLLLQVDEIVKSSPTSADMLKAAAANILPTVTTLTKLPGGDFLVKQANNEAFMPGPEAMGQTVPGAEAAQAIGPDQAQAMMPGQTVSAVSDPVENTEVPEDKSVLISEFGQYNCRDLMGNQVSGWVFPTTLAWDGNFSETPVALFTNGSSYALQDSIAGELVGKSPMLPMADMPKGEGFFYEVSRDGARATAPITVQGGMSGPDGSPMFSAIDFMGNQVKIHTSPGLAQPQQLGDGEFAIPESWKFCNLLNQTQLVQGEEDMGVPDAMKMASVTVDLFWNGSFNLEGGCGLDKLASEYRYDLDPVSAEFMLGVLGVDGATAKQKLAEARRNGAVQLTNLKEITLVSERYAESVKEAGAVLAEFPDLRRDLVKEAAALEDESTVDKILALNFLNPENLSTFVSYQPELERTSEQLAEMLLSGYLGMAEIPEHAVEKAMHGIEEVNQALKALSQAEA